jgi:hypothetical protein
MFAGQALEMIGARETKLVIAQQSRASEVFQF